MLPTSPFPPLNASAPYGPISLLPELSTTFLQARTVLAVAFPPPPAEAEAGGPNDEEPSASSGAAAAAAVEVITGGQLTWRQTQARPSVSFPVEKDHPDATYTVLMVDPDAPTPRDTKYAFWRHWIQPGLRPAPRPGEESTSSKAPLTEYLAPGRKEPGAEPHRYLVLLYREPPVDHAYHSLTRTDVGAEHFEARRAFDAKAWVTKYGLELVGVEWFWGTG